MSTRDQLVIEGFFDSATWTVSYLVMDRDTRQCALVDSVLDFDPKSGRLRAKRQGIRNRAFPRARKSGQPKYGKGLHGCSSGPTPITKCGLCMSGLLYFRGL